MKKKRTPFVSTEDNKFYIESNQAGIHPLCLLADGVPMMMAEGRAYLEVTEAIKWHEKELEIDDTRDVTALECLRDAQQRFEKGEVNFTS